MKRDGGWTRAMTVFSAAVLVAGALFCFSDRGNRAEPWEGRTAEAAATARPDALLAFSEERARVRQMESSVLSTMAADEEADAGTRARARSELLTLTSRMETETTVEGVLRMRGFEDAVVTVSANSVNVVVRADTLSQAESAAILELVMRETGQSGANVKIMTVPR